MNPITLKEISERLRTQDNRCTSNPMFQLRIKVRIDGLDTDYSERFCWHDSENQETIYDDDPGFTEEPFGEQWERFGYRDHWETVMVAFTEQGLKEYMEQDGHNVVRRAFRGQWEIYVDSFNRCPEMIAIREALMNEGKSLKLTDAELKHISSCPDGIDLAMDYHDAQICQGESMGFDCSGNKKRYDELKAERDRIKEEWEGSPKQSPS